MNENRVVRARSHLLAVGVAVAIALSAALGAADLWALWLPVNHLFAH
jgi:hypothetical protein